LSEQPGPGPGSPGHLAIVLHAHLPFVRHPEHEFFLEEDWFFEAVTETYVPLIRALEGWAADGVDFRLALSITPPLMNMLADRLLRTRYERHLTRLTALCDAELQRTRGDERLHRLARHYRRELDATWAVWRRWDGQLLHAFRRFLQTGRLEILTSAATHGYLPLLRPHAQAVRAQIAVGVQCYERHMGQAPRGIWLPECGYYPGLDEVLAAHGLRYFVVDAHGVQCARPRPRFGVHAPLYCPDSGVAVFGRDLDTAHQVWSRDEGYPGDPAYREFYRDIGYDLELDYIGPWVQPDGTRKNTGIKYHRITGPGADKELYDPTLARRRARVHAAHFVDARRRQLASLARDLGRSPIALAAYDAELFGHWWYEGPRWLDGVVRRVAAGEGDLVLTHPVDYLTHHPTQQVAAPAESSWGDRGYHEFWCAEPNAWIYPLLHRAAERMTDLARRLGQARGLVRRALNQAARELLLAQSSDWAFIMKTGTVVEYARRRTEDHLARFDRLWEMCDALGEDDSDGHGGIDAVDEDWLADIEARDNIFGDLDYRVYA
jgi:1,4-alpha-glucan branching enzyme